ncbi:MAG TPA: hypothetical protein VEV21_04755 [Burkholderiales bacterium]|jgi:hypothetical protein|nr:hypothetical protein [Burkholderiales bacterium]
MSSRPIRVSGLALQAMVLAGLAASCATPPAYEQPYAVFEPGTPSAARREIPVLIHEVDGQIPVDARRQYGIPVQPGKHTVVVHFSSDSVEGAPQKHVRTLELDAAPCTRYRIVAHHAALVHVEWEPVVYQEPIGECTAKFANRS